ncbi:MAG: dihydrofolate reductase [Mycobacteriaceae bacterium]
MSDVGLIWAQNRARIIGAQGTIPWHVKEDLAHFRAITLGSAVIMGRKTWDSLPEQFRPLPGRKNLVITRAQDWAARGATAHHSIESALAQCSGEPVWVIGGGEIYGAALPFADVCAVTEVDFELPSLDGQVTYAPELTEPWHVTEVGSWQVSESGLRYRFCTYQKS